MSRRAPYHNLLSAIVPLAREINALQRQAKALGLFTDDRKLLECTGCDLEEDVDFAGRLITWHREGQTRIGIDCGLRFEKLAGDRFRCPACRTEMRVEVFDENDFHVREPGLIGAGRLRGYGVRRPLYGRRDFR